MRAITTMRSSMRKTARACVAALAVGAVAVAASPHPAGEPAAVAALAGATPG